MRKKLFFTLSILIFMVAASPAPAEPRDIAIGWLMIMDWDADFPEAPTCLRDHSDRPTDWTITFEAIFFDQLLSGEQVITDYNMVVTTGHEYYAFTADERAILESYLDAGGTLWFDDCANIEADNLP